MKKRIAVSAVFALAFGCLVANAEEAEVLEDVVVIGKKLVTPTKQTNETVYTGSEITREGLDALGTKATLSVYEATNVLPGVSVEGVDPYGLAAEQKNIRIRGVRGFLGAMTVSGVPNYGGNPMGPREYLYDVENFESIAVYKGAVPADLGTGVGARGGAIELRPRWPKEEMGLDLSQGVGANSYARSYLRLDSGKLPTVNTRFSVSGSYTDAEKWKGEGDLGPRKNLNLMMSQPTKGDDAIKLWANFNDLSQHLYAPLSYSQTRDLGANYEKDYNKTLTGDATKDIKYYDYNRGEYENTDLLAEVPLTFSDTGSMMLKPYYSYEDTTILQGSTSMGGSIIKRFREIERFGLLSQVDYGLGNVTTSVGYWFEDSDMKITQRFYNPLSMQLKGYGMVMKNDGDGIVHSPFVKFSGAAGSFDWQAGLKYFYYEDPASQGYVAAGGTGPLTAAPDLYREEKSYDDFLPTAGVSYNFTDSVAVTASYGRSQIRPYAYMPLITTYNSNRSDFQAAGVTLDDLFSGYDMEITDTVELGLRLKKMMFEVNPTIFYAKHNDLLTTVYDSRIGTSGVNYYQNIGEATGYGVEVETNFFLHENLTFFVNPTYTSLTYDDDLTYAGTTIDADGNQVVDTPEWMVKTGLIFSWRNFEVVPAARYLGERYGDAANNEKVDDYVVTDLKLSYGMDTLSVFKDLRASLEFTNLFDEEYISVINGMDDSRAGSTSYYVGAPFTTMLTISFSI